MRERPLGNRRLRVGYVVKMYPRFSETFIVNEILELERQGAEVRIFSLVVPDEGRFHGRLADVKAGVTYLPAPRHSESWDYLQKGLAARSGSWPGLQRASSHALRCGVPSSLKYLLQACSLVQAMDGLDHLHAHFATSPAHVAMYASLLGGLRFSFTAHAKDIYHDSYQGPLLADKLRHASFVVTVAEENRQHLIKTWGEWAASKVLRLYNGVDLDLFRDGGEPREERLVVAVGRLVEKKGFRYLVEASALLKKRGVDHRVLIVGEGEEMPRLRELVESLDVADRVELIGSLPQEKVIALLARATAMALPCIVAADGNRDALPTVLLEALASGLPVVSTPVTGVPEILDGGRAGLLVPPGDASALADALEQLLLEPDLRRALATRGRAHAEREFDVRRNVGLLHTLFRESAGLDRIAPQEAEPCAAG